MAPAGRPARNRPAGRRPVRSAPGEGVHAPASPGADMTGPLAGRGTAARLRDGGATLVAATVAGLAGLIVLVGWVLAIPVLRTGLGIGGAVNPGATLVAATVAGLAGLIVLVGWVLAIPVLRTGLSIGGA